MISEQLIHAEAAADQPRFFNFDSLAVRVVGSWEQPWFVAKDVCAVLEIGDVSNAVNGIPGRDGGLDADEKGTYIVSTLGGPQQMLCITESGLYSLIFRSRKPQAKLFRRWVTEVVLPAIRKTGSYQSPVANPEGPASYSVSGYPFAIAGHGRLASLPRLGRDPLPDLETEATQQLLSSAIGPHAPNWDGRLTELAEIAVRHRLFFWRVRNAEDPGHLGSLGCALSRRQGIAYCGDGLSTLQLFIVGKARGRRYLIIRDGNLPAGLLQ